jgi:hypothetical protein
MFNLDDGKSSLVMQKPDGTLITGWGVTGTDSLMPLIAWLSAVMPISCVYRPSHCRISLRPIRAAKSTSSSVSGEPLPPRRQRGRDYRAADALQYERSRKSTVFVTTSVASGCSAEEFPYNIKIGSWVVGLYPIKALGLSSRPAALSRKLILTLSGTRVFQIRPKHLFDPSHECPDTA